MVWLVFQGEVGEPGQKGSKADKGEQVSPCLLSFDYSSTFLLHLQSYIHKQYKNCSPQERTAFSPCSDMVSVVLISIYCLFASSILFSLRTVCLFVPADCVLVVRLSFFRVLPVLLGSRVWSELQVQPWVSLPIFGHFVPLSLKSYHCGFDTQSWHTTVLSSSGQKNMLSSAPAQSSDLDPQSMEFLMAWGHIPAPC